jgi:putative copper export protein
MDASGGAHLVVGLIFGIILWVATRTSGRLSFLQRILAGLSVIELVSLAWAGHAAATPGLFGVVHLLADALHLLSSAFWPGALVPLAAFLLLLFKSTQVEALWLAAPVVRRFSASSLLAVAGLALTGLSNSLFMVGSFPALLTSPYGQILVSKLILFGVMIGFGAWNLFLLKPKIVVDLPTFSLSQKGAARLLLRNVLWKRTWYFSNLHCQLQHPRRPCAKSWANQLIASLACRSDRWASWQFV